MNIRIYTTNTCAYCAMVKKYLSSKVPEGTVFDIVNLDLNPERRQEAFDISNGAMTVPITVIDEKVVVGWKPIELAKALA